MKLGKTCPPDVQPAFLVLHGKVHIPFWKVKQVWRKKKWGETQRFPPPFVSQDVFKSVYLVPTVTSHRKLTCSNFPNYECWASFWAPNLSNPPCKEASKYQSSAETSFLPPQLWPDTLILHPPCISTISNVGSYRGKPAGCEICLFRCAAKAPRETIPSSSQLRFLIKVWRNSASADRKRLKITTSRGNFGFWFLSSPPKLTLQHEVFMQERSWVHSR